MTNRILTVMTTADDGRHGIVADSVITESAPSVSRRTEDTLTTSVGTKSTHHEKNVQKAAAVTEENNSKSLTDEHVSADGDSHDSKKSEDPNALNTDREMVLDEEMAAGTGKDDEEDSSETLIPADHPAKTLPPIDLLLLVDSSGSIGISNFEKVILSTVCVCERRSSNGDFQ
ncbi:unnamed protein product [Anisakis simplex]|uniref:VWFA domain-containing protein n=1 Tax=Anisakis simplex TaxID=6269 RepID=A0A0M3J7F7_ANISI|nr:unnamed protein product [Anisakis simplex]